MQTQTSNLRAQFDGVHRRLTLAVLGDVLVTIAASTCSSPGGSGVSGDGLLLRSLAA